jgi:hypothetical protein
VRYVVNAKVVGAALALVALIVLAASMPAAGSPSWGKGTAAKHIEALVIGPIHSSLLGALKKSMGSELRLIRGETLTSNIDLVIVDGDQAPPEELAGVVAPDETQAEQEDATVLNQAARSTRWVLVVDPSKSDERSGLSHLTGFEPTRGHDLAYLFRSFHTHRGVPDTRIITEPLERLRGVSRHLRARLVRARTAGMVRLIRHALESGAASSARLDKAESATQLAPEVPKQEWQITREQLGFVPVTENQQQQTPVLSVTYNFGLYLAHESATTANPDGKYQVLTETVDGRFSPKTTFEKFIANEQRDPTFGSKFWKSRGYWTSVIEPTLRKEGDSISLLHVAPATPNDQTKYTSSTTATFGVELAKDPKATASVTIGNTSEYTISDWVVKNTSDRENASWRFSSRQPCDVRSWPPEGCFTGAPESLPKEPNALSTGSMDFHLSAVWRTKRLFRGFAPLRQIYAVQLLKTDCLDTSYTVPTCDTTRIRPEGRATSDPFTVDLNAVVPVPVESLSYQPKNPAQPAWRYGEGIAVLAGTTVTGKVKLGGRTPGDVAMPISKKDKDGRDLDPNENVVIKNTNDVLNLKRGDTEGTFTLETTANGMDASGSRTVALGIFYDGFTRSPITVCASRQSAPCQGTPISGS